MIAAIIAAYKAEGEKLENARKREREAEAKELALEDEIKELERALPIEVMERERGNAHTAASTKTKLAKARADLEEAVLTVQAVRTIREQAHKSFANAQRALHAMGIAECKRLAADVAVDVVANARAFYASQGRYLQLAMLAEALAGKGHGEPIPYSGHDAATHGGAIAEARIKAGVHEDLGPGANLRALTIADVLDVARAVEPDDEDEDEDGPPWAA